MPTLYRTVPCALTLLAACDAAQVRRITINAHYVPACAPSASEAPRQLELVALGDFDRTNDTVSILPSDASLRTLSLPAATRAAELESLAERRYWGSGALGAGDQIPILLWPRDRACRLATHPQAGPAAEDTSWLLATSSRLGSVLAVGRSSERADGSLASLLDTRDARATSLAGAPALPAYASISELGDGFVVAGGEDGATRAALATAWTVEVGAEAVDSALIALSAPRSRHAAVSLPSGSTLLIGGESSDGSALASVEVLSPDGRGAPVLNLLATPRLSPEAVLLGGDRILIGGGFVWGDGGRDLGERVPISSVEFLSTDLADVAQAPIELAPAALDRSFVALAAGAALAVGGCAPAPPKGECMPCAGGCISRDVWWIDPRGEAHALEPLPIALAAERPALVRGAEGSPWLFAADRLGRFDPWQGRFALVDVEMPSGAGALVARPSALGGGAFVWLGAGNDGVDLLGLYHNQRGQFTQDVAPLLVGGATGVAPHLPPSASFAGERALSFSTNEGLRLAGTAAAASIADTDYADFTLELTLGSGPPPLIRLTGSDGSPGAGATFGGLECPWPEPGVSSVQSGLGGAGKLVLERSADDVWLRSQTSSGDSAAPETAQPPCQRPLPERVSVQVVGTLGGTTSISRIEIRRSMD